MYAPFVRLNKEALTSTSQSWAHGQIRPGRLSTPDMGISSQMTPQMINWKRLIPRKSDETVTNIPLERLENSELLTSLYSIICNSALKTTIEAF